MFEIIKNIIENGIFRVNDLTNKIDTLWAESKLTDEERNQLVQMMAEHLNPASEAPELKELYERLSDKVADLEEFIADLSSRVKALEAGGSLPVDPEPEPGITVPVWEPWDGISNKYQYGAIAQHNGKYWQNVLSGMQNTWEPGSVGVDDRYWKEITKEEAEALLSTF